MKKRPFVPVVDDDFNVRDLPDLLKLFGFSRPMDLPRAVEDRYNVTAFRLLTRREHWLERPTDPAWEYLRHAAGFSVVAEFHHVQFVRRITLPIGAAALDTALRELTGKAQHAWETERPQAITDHIVPLIPLPPPDDLEGRARHFARVFPDNWVAVRDELASLPTDAAVVLAIFIYDAIPPGIWRVRFRNVMKNLFFPVARGGRELDFRKLKKEKRRN